MNVLYVCMHVVCIYIHSYIPFCHTIFSSIYDFHRKWPVSTPSSFHVDVINVWSQSSMILFERKFSHPLEKGHLHRIEQKDLWKKYLILEFKFLNMITRKYIGEINITKVTYLQYYNKMIYADIKMLVKISM